MLGLSVLKRCVPKTLAFAFGLRLRSKTQCFKTRVLGRRLPNGKPQERLRFRDLRSKTLAFKERIAIVFLRFKHFPLGQLSGLVAGDSAICGRLAALILRLRPAGLRFEEFRSPVKRGGLGLRFSNRSGLRPAAI